jgi:hypothetical protein
MRRVRNNFAVDQVASHDASATTFNGDNVNQFSAVEHAHIAKTNLASELLVCAEQQLLTGLTTRGERTTYLCTTE